MYFTFQTLHYVKGKGYSYGGGSNPGEISKGGEDRDEVEGNGSLGEKTNISKSRTVLEW